MKTASRFVRALQAVSLRLAGVGVLGLLAAASATSGCARGPGVASSLPLKRVVVYRNGVGYFERGGVVDDEEVRFRVRGAAIDDFLASLAVMERGGSSVRSVSFPMETETPEVVPPGPGPLPPDEGGLEAPVPTPAPTPAKPAPLRDVLLALDGGTHELAVGYLSETPIWRPSYRLVIDADGKARLQGWAIVQNLSGEDWSDVDLVLVAGSPLSFRSTLGTPVVPERPIVTDTGEIIAAMPEATTTYESEDAQRRSSAKMSPAPEAEAAEVVETYSLTEGSAAGGRGPMAPRMRRPSAAPSPVVPSGPRDLSSLATVAVSSGSTAYSLPTAVTVPDESATMVLYLSRDVPGEAVFLFAPEGGVGESFSHPFRVARFKNATDGLLERGPIAVFDGGSFVGQGLVEPLPPGGAATVPFALERGLGVATDRHFEERGATLASISNGRLIVRTDVLVLTDYKAQSGLGEPSKLLLRHPRIPGSRLVDPPAGTEEEVAQGFALVPMMVPAHETTTLVLVERQGRQQEVSWESLEAATAVKAFLDAPGDAKPAEVERLRQVWKLLSEQRELDASLSVLRQRQNELNQQANQLRRSLKAIEKDRLAEPLRKSLTTQLATLSEAQGRVTRDVVEGDMKRAALAAELRERLVGLELAVPETPAPQTK